MRDQAEFLFLSVRKLTSKQFLKDSGAVDRREFPIKPPEYNSKVGEVARPEVIVGGDDWLIFPKNRS